MKMRTGLAIALMLTLAVSGWSLRQVEPSAAPTLPAQHILAQQSVPAVPPAPRLSGASDLFPYQGPPATPITPARPADRATTTPRPPPLPFQVAGAWWQGSQRFLLLTDNRQNWLLCQQCRLAGAIRRGDKLDDNWQLREIASDHLVLRWLPLEQDQPLALDEMQSQPGF